VAFLVQLFYSWRIWVISHGQKRFIPILAIIVLVSFFLWFFSLFRFAFCSSSIDIFNLQTATASCIAGWYTGIVLPNAGSGPLAQINFKRSIKTFDLDPAVTVGGI
jgi:hypothetical protein